MRRTLIHVLAFTFLLPGFALAQSIGGLGSTDAFSMTVNPQYPAPFSTASVSFLSTSIDLTNATLAVSVGGKQIYKGAVQPVSIPLGKSGSIANVSATVHSAGTSYTQSVVIQPEDVVLVAEPISSSPVLYPGKSLVPLEGSTRIVAMANLVDASGKKIDPTTLSYAWTVDDTKIADSSGIGRSSLTVASPLEYRARTVSVIVQSQMGTLIGGDSLTLTPQEPTLRIYENDPLLGIRFEHALTDNYALTKAEMSLYAAPFSMPTSNGAAALEWFLNGTSAQTGNLLTLRPTGTGQGTASLSATATGGQTTIATANLSLSFGAAPSTNLFGL